MPYTVRVAKVFVEPLRIKIVMELNMREMSPKGFYEEFGGGSITRVSRHFDVLTEFGWLYLTRTESGGKRRGAVEHFYRAAQPLIFDEVWPSLPKSMKGMISLGIFEEFAGRVKQAVVAETIDAREDRHLSWAPLRLDQLGWENVISQVDSLFFFLFEEQKEANARMAESGEEAIPMTVALAAFESPKDTTKAP